MGCRTPPRTYACTAKKNVSKPPWGVGKRRTSTRWRTPCTRVAPTLDPVVLALAVVRVLLEGLDHLGNVVDHRGDTGDRAQRHGHVGGVSVHVDKAGKDSLALQVDSAGAVDLAGVADPGDLAVGDLEGADEFLLVARGEDLAVDENLFSGGGHGCQSFLCRR